MLYLPTSAYQFWKMAGVPGLTTYLHLDQVARGMRVDRSVG